jgi:hypothetical protein
VAGSVGIPDELPLSALLAFVSQYRGPREAAETFLLALYSQRPGRWRFDRCRIEAPRPDPAWFGHPPNEDAVQDVQTAIRHLWQGSEWFTVNWERSDLIYDGPLIVCGPYGLVFDERWRVRIAVDCVLLPTAPAVERLHWLGLLPDGTTQAELPLKPESPKPRSKIDIWLPELYSKHPPTPQESRTAWAKRMLQKRLVPEAVAAHSIVTRLPAMLKDQKREWAGLGDSDRRFPSGRQARHPRRR